MNRGARATEPILSPAHLDPRSLADARRLAADWRATGLEVGLIEHGSAAGPGTGYALVARSPTAVLRCECRSWRQAFRPWLRPRLWTITVFARQASDAANRTAASGEPDRLLGVAAAVGHERAWRKVLLWLDDKGRLGAGLEEALDEARRGAPGEGVGAPNRQGIAALRRAVATAAAVVLMYGAGVGAGLYVFHRLGLGDRQEAPSAIEADAPTRDGGPLGHGRAGLEQHGGRP